MLASRPRAFLLGVGALVVTLSAARAGRADRPAQPESFRLVWIRGERADACEDGPAIARRVSARLGREVFTDSAPRSIEGVIQHEGDRWEAHVYLRDASGKLGGSRVIDDLGPDCTSLDAAVALVIALTIDPDAALRSAAAPSPSLAPAPVLEPAPAPGPALAPAQPRAQPPALAPVLRDSAPVTLFTHVLVAAGLLPGEAPGFDLAVDIPTYGALHTTTGMLFLPERGDSSGHFAFGLTTAWLGPCFLPLRRPRASISLCAELTLGAIHSVVKQLEPVSPGDRFWAAAAFPVELRAKIAGPVWVGAGIELFVPLTDGNFELQPSSGGPQSVFSESAVAGAGYGGLGVSIP